MPHCAFRLKDDIGGSQLPVGADSFNFHSQYLDRTRTLALKPTVSWDELEQVKQGRSKYRAQ